MYIPDNKYLGKLCKRGHDYEETGKSLRYKGGSTCVECNKALKKAYRQTEKYRAHVKAYQQTEKAKAAQKAYQQTEKYRARVKAYRQTEKYRAHVKAYRQTEKAKAAQKAYQQTEKYKAKYRSDKVKDAAKARIENLADSYVKSIIAAQTGIAIKKIPPELVEIKRAQLKIIRETRKCQENS